MVVPDLLLVVPLIIGEVLLELFEALLPGVVREAGPVLPQMLVVVGRATLVISDPGAVLDPVRLLGLRIRIMPLGRILLRSVTALSVFHIIFWLKAIRLLGILRLPLLLRVLEFILEILLVLVFLMSDLLVPPQLLSLVRANLVALPPRLERHLSHWMRYARCLMDRSVFSSSTYVIWVRRLALRLDWVVLHARSGRWVLLNNWRGGRGA